MPRKYHQTKADRMREHRGMERYERGPVRHHRSRGRRGAYHQTRMDREHESRGMKKYWEDMHREDSHHHRDDRDEDETQLYHRGRAYYGPGYDEPSNLPQHVIRHRYPPMYHDLDNDYPDTLREIDDVLDDDYRKVERYRSDSMY